MAIFLEKPICPVKRDINKTTTKKIKAGTRILIFIALKF